MRLRRTVRRHNFPSFNLALPNDRTGEVQVQQKYELDANKFFIDVDDTTVSPMITTEASFRLNKEEPKSSSNVSPSGSSSPKFIHVNNTNLFVLMDGVSMFIEDHSTFYMDEDTHVVQKYITEKARKQKAALLDTLDEAIKDIEQDTGEPTNGSLRGKGFPRKRDTTVDDPKTLTTSPFYADLFKEAQRPAHGPTPFRREVLTAPSASHRVSGKQGLKGGTKSMSEFASNSSYSSLVSLGQPRSGRGVESSSNGHTCTNHKKQTKHRKPVSLDDIGRSNRALDLDDVEILNLIGIGTQGRVYRVMVDDKLYAMKRINVKEATEAANSIERQGRKRGLIKELNMIRLQRSKPPKYLMQMFNGVASVDNERQHLSILMELMSFSVEDVQKMCARIPQHELNKIAQTAFRNYITGSNSVKLRQELDNLSKQQYGSCMHILGRSKPNKPLEWEYGYDRQTALPDVILSALAADVLRGLAELHENYGIVHCDIKPANVLINFAMTQFKLTDFGCGCVIDPDTKKVRRTGVDLGSKLYKAPERLLNDYVSDALPSDHQIFEEDDEFIGSKEVVEFTAKADVWSLGIMLLELANGEHPCRPFKSDFWNYINLLKLSKMLKPLHFSPFLSDFIVRCVTVDESKRWSVEKLLQHPFIKKYEDIPRTKLKSFLQKLESESANFQRKQQREALQEQILLSTTRQARDNYKKQSLSKWREFTTFLTAAPEITDTKVYPQLSAHMNSTRKKKK